VVFALALRRQLLIALVALVFTGVSGLLLLCLVPIAFAWSARAYRIAVGLLATWMTVIAVDLATGAGLPSFVSHEYWLLPVAVVAWLAVAPVMAIRRGGASDAWSFAGMWPTSSTCESGWARRRTARVRKLASMK